MKQALAILFIMLAASLSEARLPAAIQTTKVTPDNILQCFKKHSGTYCEARLIEYMRELESLAGPKQWQIKHSDDNLKGK